MRFDLGTLDSGERSLPFGLLVSNLTQFLNEHGGSSNAFTSNEHTNYYFDVAPEHLGGALDRFVTSCKKKYRKDPNYKGHFGSNVNVIILVYSMLSFTKVIYHLKCQP